LMVGLTEYFVCYNGERPHQSLANNTPDAVYRSAISGGAMILDRFGGAVEGTPVPLRSTGDSSTAEARATTRSRAKPAQRRSAASEVECAA
jgi:putative transposase